MRKGVVLNVYYFNDASFGGFTPSVNIILKEEYKFLGLFPKTRLIDENKYGYYYQDIAPGDTVGFKMGCLGFDVVAKIEN